MGNRKHLRAKIVGAISCWIEENSTGYFSTDQVMNNQADSYAYEKLIRKWTKSVFFGFFQSYGYENGPDSYGQIRLSFS